MLLSVILPIYNVEKFLPRCLESLLRQGLESGLYEIICVNDGSPDGSARILEAYKSKYPDIIRVVTQENQGLGPARNTGMKEARGTYITFVDSDDYVLDGGYAYLCEHFLEGEPDLVVFGYRMVWSRDFSVLPQLEEKVTGKMLFETNGLNAYSRIDWMTAWGKLYKQSFLKKHDIQFVPVVSEDEIFNAEVFGCNPSSVRYTDCNIYCYEQGNSTSIMHAKDKARVCKYMGELLNNMEVLAQYGLLSSHPDFSNAINKKVFLMYRRFHKMSYLVEMSREEWRELVEGVDASVRNLYTLKNKSKIQRMIIFLYRMSSCSYLSYLVVRFFYRNLFVRFILPRISPVQDSMSDK